MFSIVGMPCFFLVKVNSTQSIWKYCSNLAYDLKARHIQQGPAGPGCVFFVGCLPDPRGMKSWFLQVPVDFWSGSDSLLQGPGTSGLADRSELQH